VETSPDGAHGHGMTIDGTYWYGGSKKTVSAAGGHNHGIPNGTKLTVDPSGTVTWAVLADHSHGSYYNIRTDGMTSTWAKAASHTHHMQYHEHPVSIPDHNHSVTIPAHTHDVAPGIFEFTYLPPSHVIVVDGTTIAQTALTGSDIDILPYLTQSAGKVTRGAMHKVEIYPDTSGTNTAGLARISANVIKQIFIQSRGGVNY